MKIKKIIYTLLILFAASACEDDSSYVSGFIYPDKDGFFIDLYDYNVELMSTYTSKNLTSIAIYDRPLGWEASITMDSDGSGYIYITSPTEEYAGMERSGKVTIQGTNTSGGYNYSYINVGMVDFVDLEEEGLQANSFIVSEPNKVYLFNPNRRGESEQIATTKATDCELTWVTVGSPIANVMMYDNMIGFYTSYDENDLDEDDLEDDVIHGNAVISALSSDGVVLWSWHIWVTDNEISSVELGGVEFMDRNLGAILNDNSSEDDILDSYGLYYQWGRKDPFIYPSTYNGAGSTDTTLVGSDGYATYYSYPEASDMSAHLSYATNYPMSFICGTDETQRDWLLSGRHDDTLWGGGSDEKSIYDPSPAGWRVPSSEDLSALADLEVVGYSQSEYSATIGGELFMAFGERIFLDGSVQNFAPNYSYAPWAGWYWSRDVAPDNDNGDKMATSMLFYLEEESDTENVVVLDTAMARYRSAGMQIRCVKM